MQRRQSSRNPGWSLSDLDFADDIIELDQSQELLQQAINNISVNGKKIGLEINSEKTKGMIIGKKSIDLELEVNGIKSKWWINFQIWEPLSRAQMKLVWKLTLG